jgi:hypothetical protein
MSEFRFIMLMTDADIHSFEQYFTDIAIEHFEVYGDHINGALGEPSLSAMASYYPLKITSPFLGGLVHNIEIVISDASYRGGDEQRSRHSADLVVKLLERGDIPAGTYEDLDEACYLYWNADGVVVNADSYAWASPDSIALREALDAAGIAYRSEDLGHYFHNPDA